MNEFHYPPALPAGRVRGARISPDLACTLGLLPIGAIVVQVGARNPDLIEVLLNNSAVAKLLVMDHFDQETEKNGAANPGGREYQSFFEARFAGAAGSEKLEIRCGRVQAIKALPPDSADAFFMRGCRDYSPLMDELYMCDSKLRTGGHIWIADYIMADYTTGQPYEVVRAVNDFAIKAAYDLVYLVLDHTMFCTAVLRRTS